MPHPGKTEREQEQERSMDIGSVLGVTWACIAAHVFIAFIGQLLEYCRYESWCIYRQAQDKRIEEFAHGMMTRINEHLHQGLLEDTEPETPVVH